MAGEIKYLLYNIKFQIAAAMEYRFNFLLLNISMFLNDVFLIIFWWIMFNEFKEMNGYVLKDILLLIGLVSAGIGLARTFFGDARRMHTKISEGGYDYYMVLPKNVLFNSIVKMDAIGLGDIVFGFLIGIILLEIKKYPLYLLMCILSGAIYLAFMIIINSISFYIGRAEQLAGTMEIGIIVAATYPWSLFSGLSKFLLLTIIPAGFIGGIPVELINKFDIVIFLQLLIATIIIWTIAIIMFYKGLKRYESGSLIVNRD